MLFVTVVYYSKMETAKRGVAVFVTTALRAIVTTTVLLLLYYVLPIEQRAHESVVLRVSVGLTLLLVVLMIEILTIQKSRQPKSRAVIAMATIIPLFIVVFAWLYLTMSLSDPTSFGARLTRTTSLYFTMSVFSTVGFGDITPKSDPARIVSMVQMLGDLIVLGVVVRLIFSTASRAEIRQEPTGA